MSTDRESRGAVRVARALGDPTRFELLRRIAERGEICCRDLTALVRLSQATVSHHLRVLSEAGLAASRRAGHFTYFRVRPEGLWAYRRSLARAFGAERRREARARPARRRRSTPPSPSPAQPRAGRTPSPSFDGLRRGSRGIRSPRLREGANPQ